MAGALTYLSDQPWPAGTLVRVPLGQRELLGVVWDLPGPDAAAGAASNALDPAKLRPIAAALDALAPLSPTWRALISFAASYYQRSAGEVALAALPPQLRDLSTLQLARRLKKRATQAAKAPPAQLSPAATLTVDEPVPQLTQQEPAPVALSSMSKNTDLVALTLEQIRAIGQFHAQPGPFLLFGATGSGKTEVFMRCTADLLAGSATAQALVMVPEINLTPQLEERFKARFSAQYGLDAVVSMHSGMTPAQRLASWLAAHSGQARIVLGTRMAVFASMPQLKLIIVDEEHDPSYKSHEGARYSARDLAVYRARLDGAKVLLGSATPSLESWYHSRPAAEGGRYQRLEMPSRVGANATLPNAAGVLPLVRRVDMNHQPKGCVISPPLLDAIAQRIARGEQSMVFLNRRGYAPVLSCSDCDWKSTCPHCSAYRVFHKIDRSLRCHHCGFAERVPRACPDCGSLDIAPVGRGTERLEEQLAVMLSGISHPDGSAVRIARIDADTTKLKGSLESQLAQVHSGEVDVLVGTQMIAKGHDFRRITLVAAINPDGALFSSDFRSPERLFGLLMQAAGRAGRDASNTSRSEMWVQTFHPTHPLYEALKQHDYPAFAQSQLLEREQAGMPPFSFQALVRADARTQEAAQAFLNAASQASATVPELAAYLTHITLYPAVPMSIARVANVERAQMLVESPSRTALQRFLNTWQTTLHATRSQPACKGLLRWAIDVDPLLI
ncbi:MAG: primosomal protein N' [Rhodoferax ferrireducens]|uniref:Replication restart protein PriA n=1 Tax=Rhodoferax ferrireducens TaxID=192843 RepID=A0A1W9KRJ6_9BURK|nr:MAG: primosomal protein N' [Rhodoferax ferrireducens]